MAVTTPARAPVAGGGPPTPEPTTARSQQLKRSYLAADQLYRRFQAVKLQGGLPQLKRSLTNKAARLKAAEAAYRKLAEAGEPYWSVASLNAIGNLYWAMAEALVAVPVPAGMSGEQLDMYQMTLEDLAVPFEQKAFAAWSAAVDLARAKGIDSLHARYAAQMLAQRRP